MRVPPKYERVIELLVSAADEYVNVVGGSSPLLLRDSVGGGWVQICDLFHYPAWRECVFMADREFVRTTMSRRQTLKYLGQEFNTWVADFGTELQYMDIDALFQDTGVWGVLVMGPGDHRFSERADGMLVFSEGDATLVSAYVSMLYDR